MSPPSAPASNRRRRSRYEKSLLCLLLLCALSLSLLLYQRHRDIRTSSASPIPKVPFSSSRPLPGFSFDKILYATWSSDQHTWSPAVPILRGCDTAQLGWMKDRLCVFYVCHAGFARSEVIREPSGQFRIGASTLIEIDGRSIGAETDPSLLRLPSGGYRLFYVRPSGSIDPAHVYTSVRSAFTEDGVTWTQELGDRLQGQGLVDPEAVVTQEGLFRLYYTQGTDGRVHSALSRDGLEFVPEPGTRVDGAVSSTLRLADQRYLMVYQTWAPLSLYAAYSTDGLQFEPVADFFRPQVDGVVESPSLTVMPDNTWLLLFIVDPKRKVR